MPRISSKEAIRELERLGFEQIRQTGSHIVMKKETEEGEIGCVVPLHRELKVGTLSSILKQSQISIDEFIENLWNMTVNHKIKAIIHPAAEGGYWAEVPALPGCITEGDSIEEVMANLKDAIEGWFDVANSRNLTFWTMIRMMNK
jgi:predicted RNase H-like HicB family nuclease/predicted RNA binding protein YcfA (HicA-like mRNA interferase family)